MSKNITIISGIIGLILLVISVINYFAAGFLDLPTVMIFLIGLPLTLIYFVYNIQDIKYLFSKRAVQYISNAFVASLLVFGVIILLNFISNKHGFRVDLTANKQYSLAEQTIKVLQNLEKEVGITIFFPSSERSGIADFINEYQHYSDKLKYSFFDPDKNPEIARNYGVSFPQTVILECAGKSERIFGLNEQQLTNALIKVTREGNKVIYFMTGHEEHDIESFEADGLVFMKEILIAMNYEVKPINLISEKSVPEDCAVFVINGPKSELLTTELDAIDVYINRGGKVFFLLDPYPSPGIPEYFDKWGITVGNDFVIDRSDAGQQYGYSIAIPYITEYNKDHPIIGNFNQRTLFPMVRSITPKLGELPVGVSVIWLCRTTSESWGEVDFQGDPEFDEGKDMKGPVTVAAVVTKPVRVSPLLGESTKKGVMAVFGDSDFSTNRFRDDPMAGLFLNTMNWLAEEEDLVAIPPKNPANRRVSMSAQEVKFTLYLSVFILPGIVLIFGLSVFFRRRSL